MDFSGPSLFTSLLIGSVGLVLFVYGKRMERYPQLVVGALLMIYPYFVTDVTWMAAIAVVVCIGLKVALSRGL